MDILQTNNDTGFTLMEVLIALMVFSIGVLGVALMQIAAIRGNSWANDLSEATVFGSNQIEQILSWDYDDSRLDSTNNNSYTLPDGTTAVVDGSQMDSTSSYHACWQVTDNTPVTGSKTIDLTVYWNQKGQLKRFSLQTVKAEH